MWVLTVASLTTRSAAISAFESPRARSLRTSSSRAASPASARGVQPPDPAATQLSEIAAARDDFREFVFLRRAVASDAGKADIGSDGVLAGRSVIVGTQALDEKLWTKPGADTVPKVTASRSTR